MCSYVHCSVFFFKQKTAYELRISDWSSDVCSSDLDERLLPEVTRNLMRVLLVDTGVRARIFARSGEILADSFVLGGPGGQVQIRSLPPEPEGGLGLLRRLLNLVGKWLPGEDNFPLYREAPEQRASDYGEVTGRSEEQPSEL